MHYSWPNVNYIQDIRFHICRKHFVTNFQVIIFWLPFFNLCPWASYHMIFNVIFPNIPSNLPDLHWPMALSIRLKIITNITDISKLLLCINFNVFGVTIIARLWQDTNWQNHEVKHPHVWAFCPKQWLAFCLACILFPSKKTQKCWYTQVNWNRNEIELRRTLLSNVESLQILISEHKIK